ncbi:MAG TPA: (2Fe-2S)-binding protein [Steroidobacteraceae bacterium]|nr:(2Fe-2S)-binding protein [Steroidobacteraceae bacterium]
MYVCVCHAVTDRDIRQALDGGANSLPEVQSRLPVGGCCGRCQEAAQQVVEQYLQSRRCDRAA